MDLTPYVDNVRREFAVAAEAGGDETRALAERLAPALVSAIRLTLLDALAAAAEEITRDLAPGSVEVRLRTGEASFAVTPPAVEAPAPVGQTPPEPEEPAAQEDEGNMVRINLRLPEQLKARVEEAAAEQGRSVNAWLVRAASSALRPAAHHVPATPASGNRTGQRFTGWVG
jgi:HicB-like protein involved in pilus formation